MLLPAVVLMEILSKRDGVSYQGCSLLSDGEMSAMI